MLCSSPLSPHIHYYFTTVSAHLLQRQKNDIRDVYFNDTTNGRTVNQSPGLPLTFLLIGTFFILFSSETERETDDGFNYPFRRRIAGLAMDTCRKIHRRRRAAVLRKEQRNEVDLITLKRMASRPRPKH